jgi:hypothetical protein
MAIQIPDLKAFDILLPVSIRLKALQKPGIRLLTSGNKLIPDHRE